MHVNSHTHLHIEGASTSLCVKLTNLGLYVKTPNYNKVTAKSMAQTILDDKIKENYGINKNNRNKVVKPKQKTKKYTQTEVDKIKCDLQKKHKFIIDQKQQEISKLENKIHNLTS